MAAAVAAAAAPTADNRCVGGGGGGGDSQPQVVPLPSTAIPSLTSSASSGRRRRGLKASRSSTSSCSSSPPSSSSDEDDDGSGGVAEFGGRGVVAVKSPTVAVKRLKDLQQHLVDLDDLELLNRHLGDDASDSPQTVDADSAADMATELRQKNKDLVLAARLGKALLAKNDELSLMNERLAEEYGDKLEVCLPIINIVPANKVVFFLSSSIDPLCWEQSTTSRLRRDVLNPSIRIFRVFRLFIFKRSPNGALDG